MTYKCTYKYPVLNAVIGHYAYDLHKNERCYLTQNLNCARYKNLIKDMANCFSVVV